MLRACALEGIKVPDDTIVSGFDNIEISLRTTPNITTISQPKRDIGFTAINQLLSLIDDPNKVPRKLVLETELIIRESTDVKESTNQGTEPAPYEF